MTVSNQFGVLDNLENPVDLWDTFIGETLEAAKKSLTEVRDWLGGDAGKYL